MLVPGCAEIMQTEMYAGCMNRQQIPDPLPVCKTNQIARSLYLSAILSDTSACDDSPKFKSAVEKEAVEYLAV